MRKAIHLMIAILAGFLFVGVLLYFASFNSHMVALGKSDHSGWLSLLNSQHQVGTQSNLVVTTLEDELINDGYCSLREAIEAANTNTSIDTCGTGELVTDTITFDVAGIITVSTQLSVTNSGPLVIDGENIITASGGHENRIFWINPGSVFILRNLDIVNGLTDVYDGGGLTNYYGDVTIESCIFRDNAFAGSLNYGGGILNWYGNLKVFNSEFINNGGDYPETYGGGIATWNGNVKIFHSTFRENSARGLRSGGYEGYAGGGLSIFQSKVEIEDSSFINNHGYYWGGGIAVQGESSLEITGSSFVSNTTHATGGAIYIGPSNIPVTNTISIVNSTFYANYSFFGCGIDMSRGEGTITNSTIFGNTESYGYGICVSNSSLIFNNTIVANNLPDCFGNIIDGGHNLDSDSSCGFDPDNGSIPGVDPLLGPLQDNGGSTWTQALLPGSPAIDAGDNATCPPNDQRGVPRPQDGDGDGNAVCDIGAYERGINTVPPSNVSLSGVNEGYIGQLYAFTSTVEPVSTTLPITYTWQVDGSEPITQTNGLVVTETFSWPTVGIHNIVVTARNAYGMVEGIHQVSISGQPISGLQAYSDAPTLIGEKTTFSATVETGTDVMYTWEFGDGDTAEGQLVTHTYTATGTYSATVTASNSENSEMTTISVEVLAPKFRIFIPQLMRIENPGIGWSNSTDITEN